MHYAFIDEFGGVGIFAPDEPVLVVAAVITTVPRNLELVIRRVHRSLGAGSAVSELKASRSDVRVIRRVLQSVAAQDVAIIIVVVDKRRLLEAPKEPEDLYRQAVARVVRLCVARWPRLEVFLDRRYTHEHLRRKLERRIRDEIADVSAQAVVIRQEDSQAIRGLQVADFVAWAMGQKYQRGDDRYCELIEKCVVAEEVIPH